MKDSLLNNTHDILISLDKKKGIDFGDAVLTLLNLSNPYKITKEGIEFYPSNHSRVIVPIQDKRQAESLLAELISKYSVHSEAIRESIVHNFTRFLEDNKKSSLGQYYTPEHLVNLVYSIVKPHVKNGSHIVDVAAGCGAFLVKFKESNIVASDIDRNAVNILRTLGFENTIHDNSLLNVNREKYNLNDNDHCVIVGNPPYNDVTSRNKKYGNNTKQKPNIEMDRDILTNDLGISFLRAFNKLKADVICVLHPLSYLIKKANFTSKLREFPEHYILKRAVIFSSREFSDTQQTPFPVVAALYTRDMVGMDYEYIRHFNFEIFRDQKRFALENMETTDGYIRKYPPVKKDRNRKSDIGLYMHNFRDINSLIAGGNLTEKEDFNTNITIDFEDLHKYAYLNCMKRYFKKDFRFGNLSPIVNKQDLENDEFLRDVFIIGTIVNNQRLSVFNIHNKNSIIFTKSLAEEYERKKIRYSNRKPDIYTDILRFVQTGDKSLEPIRVFITEYFETLKSKMIS